MKDIQDEIRKRAEGSLESFIRLIAPQRVLGNIHVELISWWTKKKSKSYQLVLLPRDHGKSALVAYRVAWEITKNPAIRVLYISSTANLAVKQLKFIKDILLSDTYRRYWPLMVNADEMKREKWTEGEISVDHPIRKKEAVRDPTIFTAGLTTGITGLHCDIAVLDDVVVQENAYTEEGREKVRQQYSLLTSIEGAEAEEWVVGTRYHPKDLYASLQEMEVEGYDAAGDVISSEPLYEIFERQVESVGDGTGEFLWPRQQRYDGKWFGFDQKILGIKRSKYLDKVQFRAQYYNNPNDAGTSAINPEYFQYYKKELLQRRDGIWRYSGRRLNVFCAVDFAFSIRQRSDYTALVVLGIDSENNYLILDISRFKTNQISDYFSEILRLHQKWDFRKIRCEVSVAQQVIVKDLKDNYIKPHGLALSIDEHRPSRYDGNKEERIEASLQPRYANRQIWHYDGGNCQLLEEELVNQNPPHDDIKDALASCIDVCVPPTNERKVSNPWSGVNSNIVNARFGGVAFGG